MIKFHKITKTYPPDIVALNDVSFGIGKGEFAVLTGRSGAGKTTLFKLLLGQETPDEGQVIFDGQDIASLNISALAAVRRRIGVVFQDYKLLNNKTISENMAYVLEAIGCGQGQICEDVPEVLDLVGLAKRADSFPEELSGGEAQRAAIARAFVHRPDVILADEPTGNLDPYHTRDIIKLLLKINEMGATIILASHDKEVVNGLGKRVITLEQGRVLRDEANGKFVL
ncbi:MAG: ATP-binding cassette domain-containing protein, partial [Patescibacteria group bacterium]